MMNIAPHQYIGNVESMLLKYPSEGPPEETPSVYLTPARMALNPTGSQLNNNLSGERLP
jgi:hypothetical protein